MSTNSRRNGKHDESSLFLKTNSQSAVARNDGSTEHEQKSEDYFCYYITETRVAMCHSIRQG